MAKILSDVIELDRQGGRITPIFSLSINGVDHSDYLIDHNVSFDRSFGSSAAQFTLFNKNNIFSASNSYALSVGDIVQFSNKYDNDDTIFYKFYGVIENRTYNYNATMQTVTISCLDYISYLKNWDINLKTYGTKIEVKEELLTPSFFTSVGEEMFAQVFNFANDAIAQDPPVILSIRDKGNKSEELQTQGFEVIYSTGQVKFGAPINARDNYDVYARKYYFYQRGLYIEDIIQEVLTTANGYGDFLFNEPSAQAVINNHLTTTYLAEEGLDEYGSLVNYLVPNSTEEEVIVHHQLQSAFDTTEIITTTLAQDFDPAIDTVMYLDDTTGIDVISGRDYGLILVDGQEYLFSGVDSGNTLTGVSGYYSATSGVTVTFDTEIVQTSIVLESTEGLPSSGSADINGDIFSWTSKDTTHLYGITNLTSKPTDSWLKYTITSAIGQTWYLSYTNLITDLTISDFDLPSGSSLQYVDKKFGRIVLDAPISTSATVACTSDYSFYTLQATGIEINGITFTERNTENRFSALQKLFEYVAPNYIIYTNGDTKVWSKYLYQKTQQDYNLTLTQGMTYLEDSDIYTRVKFWAKNINPTNIMFNDGVAFVTNNDPYSSLASNDELTYIGTENGWHQYATYISSAGYITADSFVPEVYINNVKVDNSAHLVVAQPVTTEKKTTVNTKTTYNKWVSNTKTNTYYHYDVQFSHQSLYANDPIYLYSSSGTLSYTIPPNSPDMDYSRGIWIVPGDEENALIEDLSTASYSIFYASNSIKIDYDNVLFYIKDTLIPDPARAIVNADYEYIHTMTPLNGVAKVIDGRWDTQVQTEFFSNPPTGYNYAILDLGQVYDLQAIDIIAGFYRPDDIRKFDIDSRQTLQYSTNGSDFFYIGDALTNFELQGGQSVSFEEEDLGVGFQARYIKISLDNVEKIAYTEKGTWVVAFTEIAAFNDLIISSEAKLIPVSYVSNSIDSADTVIPVDTTKGFTIPESGQEITAYIDGNEFTYSGLTDTSFTGCTIGSGESYTTNTVITKSIKNTQDIYDYNNLYYYQGDRLYKDIKISDEFLYTQDQLDRLSKVYLEEFVKEHTKVQVDVVYSPHLEVGQTVRLVHSGNNIDRNYFVEAVSFNGYTTRATLAYYSS